MTMFAVAQGLIAGELAAAEIPAHPHSTFREQYFTCARQGGKAMGHVFDAKD